MERGVSLSYAIHLQYFCNIIAIFLYRWLPADTANFVEKKLMKAIASLYSLKGIACLMVVMGHIPSIVRAPLSPILRGVPLFLMISGYLLYTPDGKELSRKAVKQLKKICCIIICVHTVYAIYSALRAYFSPTYIFPIQTWEGFLNWAFCGTELGHGVLWYLHTYAWTLVVLWALSCKGSVGYMRYLPFLLVANLILGRYQFLFPFEITHFGIRQNCFTVGLPYFAIGYLVHKNESRLHNITLRRWMSIMLCSLIAVYAEIVLLTLLGKNNHFLSSTSRCLSRCSLLWQHILHGKSLLGLYDWGATTRQISIIGT